MSFEVIQGTPPPSQNSLFAFEGVLPPHVATSCPSLAQLHPSGISKGISTSMHFASPLPSAGFS